MKNQDSQPQDSNGCVRCLDPECTATFSNFTEAERHRREADHADSGFADVWDIELPAFKDGRVA